LNLNARGISGQSQYFQDPISPFFAAFSGLPVEPKTFTGATFSDGTGTTATAAGIAPTGQAFNTAGSGERRLIYNADGSAFIANGATTAPSTATFFDGTAAGGANVDGIAAANQLINAEGQLLFTDNTFATPATFTSPAGSGNANGNTIEVGTDGNVNATATALGSSTSSNVTGDSNSFAGIFSSGATLIDKVTIGQDGNVSGTSNLGYDPAITDNTATTTVDERIVPISTSSSTTTGSSSAIANLLSIGVGTAAVRKATPVTQLSNIGAGTTTTNGSIAPISPASLNIGRNGNVSGNAKNYATTAAKSTTGDAVSFSGGLTGSGGNTFATSFQAGNALTVGLFNLDITGVGHNNVSGDARSGVSNEATTVTGDATVRSVGVTAGIFGNDTSAGAPANTDLRIVNGDVSGIAQAVNAVKANTITGNASATINTTAVGIGNTNITISGSGSITGSVSLVGLAGTTTMAS
jgi:hypothetical protein